MEIKVTKRIYIGCDLLEDLINDRILMTDFKEWVRSALAEPVMDALRDMRLMQEGPGRPALPPSLAITLDLAGGPGVKEKEGAK